MSLGRRAFPAVLTAAGRSRGGHPWSLPVCWGGSACVSPHAGPAAFPVPHLPASPPSPTQPLSSLLPYGVSGGPSPGFLLKGKPRAGSG